MLNNVPEIKKDLDWSIKDNKVEIIVENKGIFNFILQKMIKKPKNTTVHLDEIGSFIWCRINGKSTVYEIAKSLEKEYGKNASPLYERIEKYFEILKDYRLISTKRGG